MLDFIGLAVEIGRRSGIISAELFGSVILLITGYKGYVGSKDGTDLIEMVVHAGSIGFLVFGALGLLTIVIQILGR